MLSLLTNAFFGYSGLHAAANHEGSSHHFSTIKKGNHRRNHRQGELFDREVTNAHPEGRRELQERASFSGVCLELSIKHVSYSRNAVSICFVFELRDRLFCAQGHKGSVLVPIDGQVLIHISCEGVLTVNQRSCRRKPTPVSME